MQNDDYETITSSHLKGFGANDFTLSAKQLLAVEDASWTCVKFAFDTASKTRIEVNRRTQSITSQKLARLNTAWLRLVTDCLRFDSAAFSLTVGIADFQLIDYLLFLTDAEFAVLVQGDALMLPRYTRDEWLICCSGLTSGDTTQIINAEQNVLQRLGAARQQANLSQLDSQSS